MSCVATPDVCAKLSVNAVPNFEAFAKATVGIAPVAPVICKTCPLRIVVGKSL